MILCSCAKQMRRVVTINNESGKKLEVRGEGLIGGTVTFYPTYSFDFDTYNNNKHTIEVTSVDDSLTHYKQTIHVLKKDITINLHE